MNYICNVLLGCLWSQILYGKGYIYYLVKSLIKNSLLLPLEVIAMAALFSVLLPVFSRFGLLPGHEKKELERLKFSVSVFPVFGLDCLLGGACSLYYSTTIETGIGVFRGIAVGLFVLGVGLIITGAVLARKRTKKAAEPAPENIPE